MEAPGMKESLRPYGCSFGPNVTDVCHSSPFLYIRFLGSNLFLLQEFLTRNGLQMIIRSHEVRMAGYSVEHGGKLVCIHYPFVLTFPSYTVLDYPLLCTSLHG